MSRSAPDQRVAVGVVVERRKAVSQWVDHIWQAVAVLPGAPDTAPWTKLDGDDAAQRFYIGGTEVALFRGDTARYRDNLGSGDPRLWVVLRPTDAEPPLSLHLVSADPSEGEAHTEAGNDLVEALEMPQSVSDTIAAFIAEHHVEQTFYKRKRDRSDPEALARRGSANGRKKDKL